jgi:hypothetical protein
LTKRAKEVGRTKSELIRDAIDEYFNVGENRKSRLKTFRSALDATFGVSPHLPSGAEYVEVLRQSDAVRLQELPERRKS